MPHSSAPLENTQEVLTYSSVRDECLRMRLDLDEWDGLIEKIKAFSPDVLVLLTRKMPRLAEILKFQDKLPHVKIVSDFTISWEFFLLAGKKIAVVDDSRCKGTTLTHVCKKLLRHGVPKGNIQTFVVASQLDSTVNILESIPCITERSDTLSDTEYRAFTCRTALAPSLQPMPCELEFPVFCADYAAKFDNSRQIFLWLGMKFGPQNVHDITLDENFGCGLERYSIDMAPNLRHNYKFRLYLDDSDRTMHVVPMAPPQPLDETFLPDLLQQAHCLLQRATDALDTEPKQLFCEEPQWRFALYMASLQFGLQNIHHLHQIMKPESYTLAEDAHFLFGDTFSQELRGTVAQHITRHRSQFTVGQHCGMPVLSSETRELGSNDTYFWDHILHREPAGIALWTSMKQWKPVHGILNFDMFFREFFSRLATQLLGEMNPAQYALRDKQTIQDNPYFRLRVGPSFADLLHIMGELWEKLPNAPKTLESLHNCVSRLLDGHIDYGQIVPVLDQRGVRVFRKGETPLFDRRLIGALHDMGHSVKLIDSLDILLISLSPEEKNTLQATLTRLDG